jgi:hypothetical protein
MKRNDDALTLKEVWRLKEEAYKAVEGLPLALHARLTTSMATAAKLGFVTTKAFSCAEASA